MRSVLLKRSFARLKSEYHPSHEILYNRRIFTKSIINYHQALNRTMTYKSKNIPSKEEQGLFSLPNLHEPSDFLKLSSQAIDKCNSIRRDLEHALNHSKHEKQSIYSPKETLYLLDSISNIVCSVIDTSELCRSVHISSAWRDSASQAFQLLSEYIAELNADEVLYHSLIPITSNTQIMREELTEEERRMATLLKMEFERGGIHLQKDDRLEVQKLNGFVVQLESLFSQNLLEPEFFDITDAGLIHDTTQVFPKYYLNQIIPQKRTDTLTLSKDSNLMNTLLKYSSSSKLRKEIYMESNAACKANLDVLELLISQRHTLASKIGYPSYAHYFLSDKMAQHPSIVHDFLLNVNTRCDAQYKRDLETLQLVKTQVDGTTEPLQPWDMTYYMSLSKAHYIGLGGDVDSSFAGHFTVMNSIEGMKLLVDKLFGIKMKEIELTPQECWDTHSEYTHTSTNRSQIQKFEFLDEENNTQLGTMYFDLHPREGKYSHAAHFTVRCGCLTNDVNASKISTLESSSSYQLPVVALVCNLGSPECLSHSEVETLFHEFGHGLHSLLSRTKFQHLSGTRTAMDFVETPSHFFENFVWEESFLNVIGKHHVHGAPLPNISQFLSSRNLFRSIEVKTQVTYGLFDQLIFGPPSWRSGDNGKQMISTDAFASAHKQTGLPYVHGTHWHSRFTHLVTYGAGYYSYLYASIFAADIWTTVMKGGDGTDMYSRRLGMKLWKQMLVHGGAQDPHVLLQNILGRKPQVDAFFDSLE